MYPPTAVQNKSFQPLVLVKPEPPGQYTAEVIGIADIRATAATRQEAIEEVRAALERWLAAGQLVSVEVSAGNTVMQSFGRVDPNDPDERAYLQELARLRQEDLEQSLQE